MLSIIISSYQEGFYSALENNIGQTVGMPYEMIKVHNPSLMGICEAYNTGASIAKYDNLLFIHEDILFLNHDWGELLINHLNCKNTGVIGLAGSNYVPMAPSSWSLTGDKYNFGNVNSDEKKIEQRPKPSTRVFALDGVFLAVKKEVYQEFHFDEKIKGFHGYDTDFSLRVATKFDNSVIWDIFIHHFSKGNPDKTWIDNNMQIRNKIKYDFNEVYDLEVEIPMFNYFFNKYFEYYNFNLKNIKITWGFVPPNLNIKDKYLIFNKYLRYLFYTFKK